jgi:site-specific recombinase XerD
MTQEHEDLLALAAAHLLDPSRAGRRLAATVRCYIKDVRSAFRYLAAHGISAALAWPANLQQYLDSLSGRYRPTTIRRQSVSLRAVYRALAETGAIAANPAVDLAAPKRRPASRKPPLPTQTAKLLLAAPQPSSVKGVRDRAILTGLLCHGLAVSEVCALNIGDLDLAARTLRVTGRRGRVRTVELTTQTSAVLRRWLAARALLQPDTTALLVSLHWTSGRAAPGQRISVRGVRQMVRGYLAQVGMNESGVSCQALRRTYTTLTLAAGADLRAVAASLGHVSTATTQAYAGDTAVVKENPARYLSGLL